MSKKKKKFRQWGGNRRFVVHSLYLDTVALSILFWTPSVKKQKTKKFDVSD